MIAMVKYEDECVGCPPEMGCLGKTCPYKNVKRYYCDTCKKREATHQVDDEDFCDSCLDKYLNDYFVHLSLPEKAQVLNIDIKKIDD